MDLVLRDVDDDRWVYIGNGKYAQTHEVQRGVKYAEQYAATREFLESTYGPIVVEFSEGA